MEGVVVILISDPFKLITCWQLLNLGGEGFMIPFSLLFHMCKWKQLTVGCLLWASHFRSCDTAVITTFIIIIFFYSHFTEIEWLVLEWNSGQTLPFCPQAGFPSALSHWQEKAASFFICEHRFRQLGAHYEDRIQCSLPLHQGPLSESSSPMYHVPALIGSLHILKYMHIPVNYGVLWICVLNFH